MPRKIREEYRGSIYHVLSRGTGGKIFFWMMGITQRLGVTGCTPSRPQSNPTRKMNHSMVDNYDRYTPGRSDDQAEQSRSRRRQAVLRPTPTVIALQPARQEEFPQQIARALHPDPQ
jgi:hypothetical protein